MHSNKLNNMKSGISTFQIILIAIIGYFFVWPYVEENYIYKDSPKYLVQFKEAIDAQSKAKEVKYVFKNENTKNFIKKWKDAEREVTELREKFVVYKDETENFVDNLDTNLDKIKNDEKLKTRMKEYSKGKAIKMANNITKIEKNLQYLEGSILKGNNLIIALETVSSFNELVEDVKEFDSILNTSNDVFIEIDKLVNEGIEVLDKEMQE